MNRGENIKLNCRVSYLDDSDSFELIFVNNLTKFSFHFYERKMEIE